MFSWLARPCRLCRHRRARSPPYSTLQESPTPLSTSAVEDALATPRRSACEEGSAGVGNASVNVNRVDDGACGAAEAKIGSSPVCTTPEQRPTQGLVGTERCGDASPQKENALLVVSPADARIQDVAIGKKAVSGAKSQHVVACGVDPNTKVPTPVAKRRVSGSGAPSLARVERLLKEAGELVDKEEFEKAEENYVTATKLAPKDWRCYYGHAVALQRQERFLRVFSICRQGLGKLPGHAALEKLQEEARLQYKADKKAADAKRANEPKAPVMTKEQANAAIDEALEILQEPANYDKLSSTIILARASSTDPMAQQMAMQTALLPMATVMFGPLLKKYGYKEAQIFDAMITIQFTAMGEPEMEQKVKRISDFLFSGKLERVGA
eukprot:TRINITY_DN42756_c0_g1_i1.p1 TRINITY_DN42756_c0_g1~~TRINITY_DN42756_c0_g1_i1.p1  ORF type:complete len:383 (-),score=86.35 TRINITY_DN42756_c0_g1_i1:121-1269(-)